MNNKLNKLVAKASAAAMIASMLLPVSAARAAAVVDVSDTMSAGVAGGSVHTAAALDVDHLISMELTGPVGDDVVVTITDSAANPIDYSTGTAGSSSGTCPVDTITPTDGVITFAINQGAGCDDGDTIIFTITDVSNVGGPTIGSHTHTITSAGDAVTGQYAVAISANDQITVTASVDPSITFEIWADDEACTTTPVVDYTVALGVLSAAAVTSSGDQDTDNDIDGICALLNTNAANGAVVTVKSDSPGASGTLASASVPTDVIPATDDVDAGVSGWGLCVNYVERADTTPTGSFQSDAAWDTTPVVGDDDGEASAVCTDSVHGASEVALTDTAQPILNTGSDGVGDGLARMLVKASVSGTQPAHTDYTATLTFVATGTF